VQKLLVGSDYIVRGGSRRLGLQHPCHCDLLAKYVNSRIDQTLWHSKIP